ncbi:hypothetical protein WDW37_20890 [Bdellovibrionota bacterium FG-1]
MARLYRFYCSFRIPIVITACAALSLTVVRCGPLAPSLDKFRTRGSVPSVPSSSGQSSSDSAGLGAVSSQNLSSPPTGQASTQAESPASPVVLPTMPPVVLKVSRLLGVAVKVEDFIAYSDDVEVLPADQKITLSPDSHQEEFESFKAKKALLIHYSGLAPDSCRMYLGLATSATLLQAQELEALTTDCVRINDTTLKLSISSLGSEDWQWIETSLQSVTLLVTSNPKLTVQAIDDSPPAMPTVLPQPIKTVIPVAAPLATPVKDPTP